MTTTPETPNPPASLDTTNLPAEGGFIGSGQEGGIRDQARSYIQRVRSGDMGALPAIGGLIVLVILFTILSQAMLGQQFFLTERNFANLLTQASSLVMLAMALVFVILLGEIDLSAGVTSGVALSAFVVLTKPDTINMPWVPALLIALAVGVLIGAFIGFFVARVGIPSFVVTLGLFIGLQGVTLILLGAGGVFRIQIPDFLAIENSNLPVWGGWVMLGVILVVSFGMSMWDRALRTRAGVPNRTFALVIAKLVVIAVLGGFVVAVLNQNRSSSIKEIVGVPIVVPIVLVILWVGTFLLDRTKFGRYIYAIGGNAEAARRSGIKVITIRWAAFIVCSVLAVVAGVFSASKVGSVNAGFGVDTVLSGVAAAVVGGVSLFGGRGRLMHAAIGALVIAVIANGLGLLNLPAGVNYIVTGGVLILAATVDAVSRVRAGGSLFRT
ncbi:sugar ABC transporter permease [Protaetiibacter mangrovi]|uniref:Xylose transport system permease protein XylH n=1 Tax=Protaetiibacter mangrovi TaxID=2970926 RepID=A0ABT1ZJ70_9MICO|nr:ABC transporter permease [Protaetiibacter mangrovi]MCS0500620.1 ABC transporter permease [Protaetiibacter mangrovi]TPW92078.1 ABC transporter permease [Schumannella luteola]